ncbi:hypothetical protein F2P79_000966 [Pimephales promelas]|nr:hypothetical protein F2P79_000966 [Pimephales promelas]
MGLKMTCPKTNTAAGCFDTFSGLEGERRGNASNIQHSSPKFRMEFATTF